MKILIPSPRSGLGDDVEESIRSLAAELGCSRDEMLKRIVREWLEQNAYLPFNDLREGN